MSKKVNFRDFILGGQDGLVNVLGLVLGVASATLNTNIVLISGIVATVAESVSMAAVAYTSSRAQKDYYKSLIRDDKKDKNKVKHRLFLKESEEPLKSAGVVGLSTVIGSIIPLLPFFFFKVKNGIIISLIFSAIILFIVGVVKGKLTTGNWKRSGFELMIIGIIAALVGYGVGLLLNNFFGLNINP
ncbi:MAG TPA: VIT1/CCC1 transporter family protein [Candidatus Nanoarchaeia archaeon]|nr:VIT1/CCC1 transporter family protein [Candidatus Nanoarchaeia archaeon]